MEGATVCVCCTGVDPGADNWLECFIKNVYGSTPHV